MKKHFLKYFIITILFIASAIIYYSFYNYQKDVDQRYTVLAQELHLETKTLIEQKKEATLLLALSLAKDTSVKDALKTLSYENLSLKDITDTYTTYTTFQNVWIHLVTAEGVSFLKSWTDRKGESILDIRKDIVAFLKSPRVKSLVSVGKYDMTIKAMVPIYDGNKLLGLFEVITKVNSIAKKLGKEDVSPIVLVDKKYKKQLRHAFTNTFVQDYYVANLEVNPKILKFIDKFNIDQVLQNTDIYQIVQDKLLSIFHLKDVHNEEMGYFLLFKDLSDIKIDDIQSRYTVFVLVWLGVLSVMFFGFFYLLHRKYTSSLESEIDIKTKELRVINENLQATVKNEVEKNRQNEIKLFQQEKLLHIAQMFQNIAHHWRQPLSAITTSLSGLIMKFELDKVSEDEIKTTINGAMKHAEDLSSNIDFFANSYAKTETTEKVVLQKLIEDAVKILEPVLDEKNIEIIKNYDKTPLELICNKSKFINMIVTILQNSYESLLKTSNDDKHILIELNRDEDYLYLIIEDNGIGIKSEVLDKIFEPYTTTKHQTKGVGLSLYLAHNIIVDELKGSIEAKNTENGAKVEVKLPLL